MTPVGGRPLIAHALERFRAAGVGRVTVIINEESDDCRRWLGEHGQDLDLDLVVRTTPSSYASFALVAERLAGAPALITTVDAIMPADAFQHFVASAAALPEDAVVLGLTAHVDDEKPLWASLDGEGRIRRLGGPRSAMSRPGSTGCRRSGSRRRRRVSPACATISDGWSTRAGRSMASSCRSCSTSTARATSRRPSRPGSARAPEDASA